ncbi:hypothetical protein ACFU8W_48415 [Streptomyces sp. NPDC057565]|uniref:hypothetical protein n=1 Tax=Streptomyces sp. NPDC057565 TaxID=3346169 RepID=UPI0036910F96
METPDENNGPDNPEEKNAPDHAGEAARAASAPDPLAGPDPLEARLTTSAHPGGPGRIVTAEWARHIPPIMARVPQVRIGRRWFSILWLLPIMVVGLLIGIAVAQQLRTYPAVQDFVKTYPGQGSFQPPVTLGFPLWLRILHFLNLLFLLFIIRAGIQILADHPRLQFDAGSTPGKVAAAAWPGAGGPDGPGTARACLDGQGRRGQSASVAWPAGDPALDRSGPVVALQLRPALAHQRCAVLRVAVHHRAVAAAGAAELGRDPQCGFGRDPVPVAGFARE